jgi:hypothetical protein
MKKIPTDTLIPKILVIFEPKVFTRTIDVM